MSQAHSSRRLLTLPGGDISFRWPSTMLWGQRSLVGICLGSIARVRLSLLLSAQCYPRQTKQHSLGFLAAGGSVGISPGSSAPSVSPALSMLDRRSLTSVCTVPLTSSVAKHKCLCLGSRNDAMNATFHALLTSAGPSLLSRETDTVLLNPLILAFSPGISLRCLGSKVTVTGYTMEMDTSYSPHNAAYSLVILLSDKAAHMAHSCSSKLSNISYTEFHLVLQDCTNLCSGKFWSCCFCLCACVATVLRLPAPIMFFMFGSLKPSFIAS